MLNHGVLAFLAPALLLGACVRADGLYSKKSAVLQVDGKSYDKLIAKSNQVSVSPCPGQITCAMLILARR